MGLLGPAQLQQLQRQALQAQAEGARLNITGALEGLLLQAQMLEVHVVGIGSGL